jgi:hypothetical protein
VKSQLDVHPSFSLAFFKAPTRNTPSLIGDNHFINAKKKYNTKVKSQNALDLWRDAPIAIKMPKARVRWI